MVPVPAISGNAMGTIEAVSGISSLYKRMPRIISMARKKITSEPAIAKDLTSTPRKRKMVSPKKRKTIIMIKDTTVACSAFIYPTFVFIWRSAGIEPMISITAKRMVDTVSMSWRFMLIVAGLWL